MKIAVIGPVEPFRSGIARHTTALARALAQEPGCEVRAWSFSRQYPALLFPGEEQVEPGAAAPADFASARTLDTLWPPSWHATASEVTAWGADLAIIPCWTFFTAPSLAQVARALRRKGVRVVALVHNPNDHEAAGWKQALFARQLRAADAAVAHSLPVAEELARIVPELAVRRYPHPLYDTHPPSTRTLPRRAALELLFFGLVRPYKGLDVLLDALPHVGHADWHLTIAGEVWGDAAALGRRIAALPCAGRIEFRPGHVPDDEAADLFARADIVVAPYLSATGSGVVALAHHYRRPVIASDLAVMREAIEPGRTGWLPPVGDAAALARLLSDPAMTAQAAAMYGPIAGLADNRSWAGLARTVLAAAA